MKPANGVAKKKKTKDKKDNVQLDTGLRDQTVYSLQTHLRIFLSRLPRQRGEGKTRQRPGKKGGNDERAAKNRRFQDGRIKRRCF